MKIELILYTVLLIQISITQIVVKPEGSCKGYYKFYFEEDGTTTTGNTNYILSWNEDIYSENNDARF